MPDLLQDATLIAATIATGMTAGLLYAFASSIMPGLGRTGDRTLVGAFQAIDRAIINPLFLVIFVGAPGLSVLTLALHFGGDERSVLPWVAAAVAFNLATFVITRVVHLPLNAAIQAAGDPDRVGDLATVRRRFEARWVRWNIVRTVTSTVAFASLVVAPIV